MGQRSIEAVEESRHCDNVDSDMVLHLTRYTKYLLLRDGI